MFRRKFFAFFILFFICCNYLFASSGSLGPKIRLGIDNLVQSNYKIIKGKKVGLLTNNAGRTRFGTLTAELFSKTKHFTLTAIFTPEHGFYTTVPAGKEVQNDELFGVPCYSLYGANRRPTKEQITSCDVVVVDLQDIGIRSYTYISTLYKVMDAAAEYRVPVIVLDRPNPIGGLIVDGNTVTPGKESFLSIAPVAYVHGLTIGEFAKMVNEEGWLPKNEKGKARRCSLTVVKMKNWDRAMSWEDTKLKWVATSPNIPTVNSVRGAAMTGIFGELGLISIGIGTKLPFQLVGSPNFLTDEIMERISAYHLDGFDLQATTFKPSGGKYSGKMCKGFKLNFTKDNNFTPFTSGVKIFCSIRDSYPTLFSKASLAKKSKEIFCKVTGTEELYNAITNNSSSEKIISLAQKGLTDYLKIRAKYLLYD